MILKSAVLINALKAAYTSLGMTATYAKISSISFKAAAGQFMIILPHFDAAGAVDTTVLNFFKGLTDEPGAAEDATLAFFKSLADTGITTDAHVISFFKGFSDPAATADVATLAAGKGLNETVGASDLFSRGFAKTISDSFGATDDIDGSSSVEDDQEIQFFKTTNDAAATTDVLTRIMAYHRAFSHTTSATDEGSLRSQGYADFTYFAGDYVGASRTFT